MARIACANCIQQNTCREGSTLKEQKVSLKLQIYDAIKSRVISCEYPPGMQLNEDQICQQFGASRTPVRDALGRLEQEGLVCIHAKRGLVINSVSLGSVNELFEVRMRIEPYAVLVYGNRLTDDTYAAYLSRFSASIQDERELYALDSDFHTEFITASGNRYLNMVYNITTTQNARYRVLSAAFDRLEITQREHSEIAMHCLRREWDKAAESMSHHIEMSRNAIIDYVLRENMNSANIYEPSARIMSGERALKERSR